MKKILILLLLVSFTKTYSQLQVTLNLTPNQLVNQVLSGSPLSISNVTFTGDSIAIGKFIMNGNSNLNIDSGIIITTGKAVNAIGPNTLSSLGYNNTGLSDSLLDSLISSQTYDAAVLEFDFIPMSDTIHLSYVFGSEEYPEFVNSNFSDVFGVFLTGENPDTTDYYNRNIAVLPGTNIPISIGTINNGASNSGPCINCSYLIDNSSGTTVQYDAFTTVITAWAKVVPCKNYHLKIAIADGFDAAYDSGVFLKAGSFKDTETPNPKICNVGIDSNLEYNRIIWAYPNSNVIDSFNIYRKLPLDSSYSLLGSLQFSLNSMYFDTLSNVQQEIYSYEISAINKCGIEMYSNNPHSTMLLNIRAGLDEEWELSWNTYEGDSVFFYKLYRGVDSLNMQLLALIQPADTNYSDVTHPNGKLFYQIKAVLLDTCSFSSSNQLNLHPFSNMVNTTMAPNIGFSTSLSKDIRMAIYPNPNNGLFTLELNGSSNTKHNYNLEIYSAMGILIHNEKFKGQAEFLKKMDLQHLSKGVYFVRLKGADSTIIKRFIIN